MATNIDIVTSVSSEFTEDILINILKKKFDCTNVVINEIKIGGSSAKGDSYLSTIYKFTIDATGSKDNKVHKIYLPIIAKSIPKNVARRKTFRSVNFFETEIYFYEKVWPLMKEIKDKKKLNEPYEIPLNLSSYSDGKNDYIALKDLSFDGYATVQRGQSITKEYASLLLKLLANFHALSVATREQNPEFEDIAKNLKETYFDEKFRKWYRGFQYDKLLPLIRNAIKKELNEKYLEKINKLFLNDFYGALCQLTHVHNKLSVVTQGDTWLPNILVKLQDEKPVSAILIDFQLARYSTLTNDFVHFLYSCISEEVLLNHWDDLVKEYHGYLSQRIYELGSDRNIITLDDLKKDIQENSLLGIAMSMESLVMSLLKDDEIADLDTIQGENEVPLESVWNISPFEDELRNKKIAFLIKHAIDKGFIN